MKKITAIFDIGKTNKKCFLFDKNYKVLAQSYQHFEEKKDEDGYPCDDIQAISEWIRNVVLELLESKEYDLQAINFSTYGASLVHLDKEGNVLTPLYNYTKPFPKDLLSAFYEKYGDQLKVEQQTASPVSGMLNAGLQLYWLKKTKPEVFQEIYCSLHFPQFLSYLFTGKTQSDYTSIGCHTSLWDYEKEDYHDWVKVEKLDQILAPITATETSFEVSINNKTFKCGVGIHDSSAALLPYIKADQKLFLLVSTGTWSICLNPFSEELLSEADLESDCLNYMRVDGKSVKAARLFLGKEYFEQFEQLRDFFKKGRGTDKALLFDNEIYGSLKEKYAPRFHFQYIQQKRDQPSSTDYSIFHSFEEAYHQLMMELVDVQAEAIYRAAGKTPFRKLYIDGGFAENDIFVHLLGKYFQDKKIRITQSPIGSALGAALVLRDEALSKSFLKKNYVLRKHQ